MERRVRQETGDIEQGNQRRVQRVDVRFAANCLRRCFFFDSDEGDAVEIYLPGRPSTTFTVMHLQRLDTWLT